MRWRYWDEPTNGSVSLPAADHLDQCRRMRRSLRTWMAWLIAVLSRRQAKVGSVGICSISRKNPARRSKQSFARPAVSKRIATRNGRRFCEERSSAIYSLKIRPEHERVSLLPPVSWEPTSSSSPPVDQACPRENRLSTPPATSKPSAPTRSSFGITRRERPTCSPSIFAPASSTPATERTSIRRKACSIS